MRFLDIVELHKVNYVNATLWLLRSGPNAGMTSLVWMPDCYSFSIKHPKLKTYQIEQMIYEFRMTGCLKPTGPDNEIAEDQFEKLMVSTDNEFGTFTANCDRPDQIHG